MFGKIVLIAIVTVCMVLLFSRCISRSKGIIYDTKHNLALDVYSPKKIKDKKEVLIFVHGGNWRSGKRSTYKFFGKGFARKGIVTVVIDYRLSGLTNFEGMSQDVARSVKWVKENISKYGGDEAKIFLSGHSSGGHLAALVSADKSYLQEEGLNSKSIKGTLLIDAFGLNMFTYLKNSTNKKDSIYFPAFTKDQEMWKKGSPVQYLDKASPPMLLFIGEKTYPAIKIYTTEFWRTLKLYQPDAKLIEVKGKKHVPMIAQFYNPSNKRYKEIVEFIKK